MKRIYTNNANLIPKNTIIALGNFDGVHLGHKVILNEAIKQSKYIGSKSSVLLLDPHPMELFRNKKEPYLLSTLEDRCRIFKSMGIDIAIIEKFTMDFALLSPEKFINDYLVNKLNIAGVVVGFDYGFGNKGLGNTTDLEYHGKKNNFNVTIIKPVVKNTEIISSSLIRKQIQQGKVEQISEYLGYNYFLKGTVVSGNKIGRSLGFPTANLKINDDLIIPMRGVYLTEVKCKDTMYYALTNIGFKPTVLGKDLSIEVHLLNFSENVYGEELTVTFLQRLRNEKAFNNISELKNQIVQDIIDGESLINQKYKRITK